MNKSKLFLDEIKNSILVGDGALGTELLARSVTPNIGIERLNIKNPDIVLKLHEEYIAAGSRVIETNTFGANIPNLAKHNAEKELREILLAGAKLARKAALNNTYVAGSIGPLPSIEGESLALQEQSNFFKDQISILLEGQVELLIFETFINIDELINAVLIARTITDIPIIAQMTFETYGKTFQGDDAKVFVNRVLRAGANVIGANCGYGVPTIINAIKNIAPFNIPMSAYMNAGFAEQIENRHIYLATADYLSKRACELADLGARLIGGCCGTNPATINAISNILKTYKPKKAKIIVIQKTAIDEEIIKEVSIKEPKIPSGILVELDPPKDFDLVPLIEAAVKLKNAGIKSITLADNPMASVRTDLLTVAGILKQKTGISIIAHLTGRDRNRIALQSLIMGAYVLGIESLLCVTGDPIRMSHETNTKGVFDVNSISLIKLVKEFNEGLRTINNIKTSFAIGAAFNPNVRSIEGQIDKLKRKLNAGAHFVLTQPIYEKERLEFMINQFEKSNINIPVFIGLLPLISAKNAEFLHNEVPGIIIPESIRNQLSGYEIIDDQKKVGQEIAIKLADEFLLLKKGIYLITPRNKVNFVLPIITQIQNNLKKRTYNK